MAVLIWKSLFFYGHKSRVEKQRQRIEHDVVHGGGPHQNVTWKEMLVSLGRTIAGSYAAIVQIYPQFGLLRCDGEEWRACYIGEVMSIACFEVDCSSPPTAG